MSDLTSFLTDPSQQWVWGALQTMSLIIGFIFVGRQINLARHQNSITHLTYFRDLWMTTPILRARREFAQHPCKADGQFTGAEEVVAQFINDLGIALRLGQANPDHVYRYFGLWVEGYWLLISPQIERYRSISGDPAIYASFEYLYRSVLSRIAKEGTTPLSHERASALAQEEAVLASFLLGVDLMGRRPSTPSGQDGQIRE